MTKPVNEKPSHNESEYFARQDAERIKELRARLDAERRAAERKSHFMRCPKCGAQLEDRQHESIRVEVCPDCHGMWLDQGEIDLLRHVSKQRTGTNIVHDLIEMFHRKPKK